MAAERGLVGAEGWFSGGERLPYDPERVNFDDGAPLRVFVRHATGGGTTQTFLPGWPDGSFGWAKVEAELAGRRGAWSPPERKDDRGYRRLYEDRVLQANEGCDFDFLSGRSAVVRDTVTYL